MIVLQIRDTRKVRTQLLPLCLPYYRHSVEVWKKNVDFKCNKYVYLLHKHQYILTGKIQIMQNNSEQIVWEVIGQ